MASTAQGQDDEMRSQVMEALRANFRPEFLNRIDETIIFKPLSKVEIGEIVEIQLGLVAKRLTDRDIDLTITDAARSLVATLGYDPTFGARPLKRIVHKHILDPLALKVLAGDIRDGEEVVVDVRDGAFTIEGTLSAAPVVA
jgi:ATP-dependent Clp protease ATP-binding subunit ClpB